MDIFGPQWENHQARLHVIWKETVLPEDIVLIGGDISWAMNLEDAAVDLNMIAALPGTKVLLKGNHDYWWSSLSKVQAAAGPTCRILQNNALRFEGVVIAGTRGWALTTCNPTAQDQKIIRRELLRLKMSLDAAKNIQQPGDMLIAMMHYPPFSEKVEETGFTKLLEEYGVETALYGHLHNVKENGAFNGIFNGVRYVLTSSDYLKFKPILLYTLN